jgi:hypothetical protein
VFDGGEKGIRRIVVRTEQKKREIRPDLLEACPDRELFVVGNH